MSEDRRLLGIYDFELFGIGASLARGATVILLTLGMWPIAIVTALAPVALFVSSRRLRRRLYETPGE